MTSSIPGYTVKEWNGDGSTTAFGFQTKVAEAGDLKVWLVVGGVSYLQTLGTHYTLSGLGEDSGVIISFVTAPPSTHRIRARRGTLPVQTINYGDLIRVPGDTTEAQLDRFAMHGQDVDGRVGEIEEKTEQIDEAVERTEIAADRSEAAAAVAQQGGGNGLVEFDTRAIAQAWPGTDPMPDTVVIRGDLTPSDALGGTFALNHPSEDTMTINGESYGRVTKPVSASPQVLTNEERDQVLTNLGLLGAYWALQPIGAPIPIFSHLYGSLSDALPPRNSPLFRYILLSAGYTASGRYNEGAITEVVSGTFPFVTASASIILPNSPLVGRSVSLINTEGRSLLAGMTAGAQRLDQFQGFVIGSTSDDSGANTTYGRAAVRDSRPSGTSTAGNALPVMSPAIASSTWKALNDGVNGEMRQGNTTHGKDITAVYVMRIF